MISPNQYQNMQRPSQSLRQFFICNFHYKSQNGGNQTSFKYLLASFISVVRLYNPWHDSGIKKKVNFYSLDKKIYYSPSESRGSRNLLDWSLPNSFYLLFHVVSLETLIGSCFTCKMCRDICCLVTFCHYCKKCFWAVLELGWGAKCFLFPIWTNIDLN